jgi:hypothetical protein
MFIATPEVFMKGSVLDLKFRLFNDDQPIAVKAEVRYVQEGVGMGVHFTNLKAEDRERIKKFIKSFERPSAIITVDRKRINQPA